MNEFLPFALPAIGEEEVAAAAETVRSGWLTTGPKCRDFEKRFAEYVGTKHAIAVNSATAGLHLALEAAGIGPGDRVLTTPYTFTATAEVIRYLGADPVFVDVEPDSLNLDVEAARCAIESDPDIRAILPVHFGGQACELLPLHTLAEHYSLHVVEDAAHAFPCTYNGRMIGSLSDATVFSFYVTKTLATGEGGMVTTDNDALADRIRVMRLHGISRDVFDRHSSRKPNWHYEVVAPGFKYNMTDVAAAIGIEQLKKAEALRRRREEIARRYQQGLQGLPLQALRELRPEETHSWHLYVVLLELDALSIDRNRFIELMSEAGIGTSVHFIPLHLHPYWRDRYRLQPEDFPVAHAAYRRAVSLPIYPSMTDAAVERVIASVCEILTAHPKRNTSSATATDLNQTRYAEGCI
jgi:dTDP-4-amino-4,6-dideoxygalactose transaminase